MFIKIKLWMIFIECLYLDKLSYSDSHYMYSKMKYEMILNLFFLFEIHMFKHLVPLDDNL